MLGRLTRSDARHESEGSKHGDVLAVLQMEEGCVLTREGTLGVQEPLWGAQPAKPVPALQRTKERIDQLFSVGVAGDRPLSELVRLSVQEIVGRCSPQPV